MLGKDIRRQGFSTAVTAYDPQSRTLQPGGQCSSACAYVFLGGVERSVGTGARIGVHQISAPQDAPSSSCRPPTANGWISMVALYVRDMGGDLGVLIPALRTAPGDMHWLSSSELSRYAVVTRLAMN